MKKTQTMEFVNLIGSILFLILGIWAWIQTGKFEEVKNTYVQPSAFPRIMIIGLLIFSVVLLIQSVLKLVSMKEVASSAQKTESINFIKDKGVRGGVIVIILCIAFVALLKPLGYVLCSAIVSLVIMYLIGKRNWIQMILVSVLVPLVMWFIFFKILTVNIPMGPLSFLRDLVSRF